MLMADADAECLKGGMGAEGTVRRLVNAMQKARVELACNIDGDVLAGTNENRVLCVAYSLGRALDALPPKEVVEAVLRRIRSVKHAPRTNAAACAALATTIRDAATGFAAQGTASAAKMSVNLPDFPIIDDGTHAQRTAQYVEWTAAPAAGRADVWSGVPRDSYAWRTAPPLQKWPKWLDRPTIVGGIELTTIKSWDVLAKKLVHAEKSCAKKRKREQEGCDSEEEEEESGEEESG